MKTLDFVELEIHAIKESSKLEPYLDNLKVNLKQKKIYKKKRDTVMTHNLKCVQLSKTSGQLHSQASRRSIFCLFFFFFWNFYELSLQHRGTRLINTQHELKNRREWINGHWTDQLKMNTIKSTLQWMKLVVCLFAVIVQVGQCDEHDHRVGLNTRFTFFIVRFRILIQI